MSISDLFHESRAKNVAAPAAEWAVSLWNDFARETLTRQRLWSHWRERVHPCVNAACSREYGHI